MAIYRLSDVAEKQHKESKEKRVREEIPDLPTSQKEKFFSALTARLFFLVLLLFDILWVTYAMISAALSGLGRLATGSEVSFWVKWNARAYITLKRASVCGISLLISLVSPSFGIMVACTYFFTYDQEGIDEVIPASLQAQFHLNKDRLHTVSEK